MVCVKGLVQYQTLKRNAYKVKMVEDLMNVTLDWDTSTSLGEETWAPRGRLVAHINEHTQAINQLSINSNNRLVYNTI